MAKQLGGAVTIISRSYSVADHGRLFELVGVEGEKRLEIQPGWLSGPQQVGVSKSEWRGAAGVLRSWLLR